MLDSINLCLFLSIALFSSLSFLPSSLIPSITASSGGVNNWCSSSGTVRNLWIDGAEGGLYFSLLNFSVDLLGLIYLSTPRSTKVYILKKMDYRGKTLVFWPGQHFQCQDAFWSSPAPRHPFLTVHISVLVCVDMPYIFTYRAYKLLLGAYQISIPEYLDRILRWIQMNKKW